MYRILIQILTSAQSQIYYNELRQYTDFQQQDINGIFPALNKTDRHTVQN